MSFLKTVIRNPGGRCFGFPLQDCGNDRWGLFLEHGGKLHIK